MSLFSNLSFQSSINKINSMTLSVALGFAMFTPSNSFYYVSEYSLNKILIIYVLWQQVVILINCTYTIQMELTLVKTSQHQPIPDTLALIPRADLFKFLTL